jgi:hypothetical protein
MHAFMAQLRCGIRACDALRQAAGARTGRRQTWARARRRRFAPGASKGSVVQRSVGTHGFTPARLLPSFATLIALLLSLVWTEAADARFERGLSLAGSGGFGAINFDDAIAFDRSLVPEAAQSGYPGGSLGELFSRGDLIGGFAAGFLGAGAVGLLFGHGVVGELSGFASVLGLSCQLALIAMLARLIWTWWRDDKTDTLADLSPRQLADAYGRPRHEGLPRIDESMDDEGMDSAAAVEDTEPGAIAKTEQPQT